MKHGIDVSKWQGNIDFNKVKAAGVDFVIIRAGYGRYINQKDPYFEQNYTRAKAAGLNVGAYWYSYAASIADANAEAAVCIEAIKGKQFEYPIFFDLEENSQFAKGKAFCSDLVVAFCGALEKAGYFAGLYMSRSPLTQYITKDVAARYTLWVAEYGAKLNYNGDVGMWQNTSSWRVAGINGNVDHDYSYLDYPTIIKNGGFNGFKKSVKGDVNGDGKINAADIVKTAAHIKGVKKLDTAGQERADVNGDGKVNAADVVGISAKIKGKK